MTLGEITQLIIFISLIPAIGCAIVFLVKMKDSKRFQDSLLSTFLYLFIMGATIFELFTLPKYLSLIDWDRQIF